MSSGRTGELGARISVLEKQAEKILSYQQLSYRWALQHHANLKQMLLRMNALVVSLRQLGLMTGVADLEVVEDRSLMPGELTPPATRTAKGIPSHSAAARRSGAFFHERVMGCRGGRGEVSEMLRQISQEDFEQLREESLVVVLDTVLGWFLEGEGEPTVEERRLGLLIICEGTRCLPGVLAKPQYEGLLRHAVAVLRGHCSGELAQEVLSNELTLEDLQGTLEELRSSHGFELVE